MKMIFCTKWDTPKEKTWSGTTYALYSQLCRKFDVSEFELIKKKSNRIVHSIKKIKNKFVGFSYDADLKLITTNQKRFNDSFFDSEAVVFQFNECPDTSDGRKHFIYQDLSVLWLYWCQENDKDTFSVCGFQYISEKVLKRRAESQTKFYQSCDAIFTMGRWQKEFLVNYCNISADKVFAVGGGINFEINNELIPNRTGNKILFIGRDFVRKGGPETCAAFAVLRSRFCREAELYIAGVEQETVMRYAESMDGITVFGDVTNEKARELFLSCDVFCMPSKFEAYGLVFAEALCLGLPCIARNKYEMQYFISHGENGYLLDDSDSIEEYANYMYSALTNCTMKRFVFSNRDLYLKKYDWKSVAKSIEDTIFSIM